MIAGGSAHGSFNTTQFDPARVAHSRLRCDPFRVGVYSGPVTGGDAPGYHMLPLQGKGWLSEIVVQFRPE